MRNPVGNAAELSYGLPNGATCPPCNGMEPIEAGVKFKGTNALAVARISPREFASEAKLTSGPKGKAECGIGGGCFKLGPEEVGGRKPGGRMAELDAQEETLLDVTDWPRPGSLPKDETVLSSSPIRAGNP